MKRHRISKILGSVLAVLLIAIAFLYWQVSKLKFSFNDKQIEKAQTLALSAMGNAALDHSLLDDPAITIGQSKPLLDQYKDNPALVKQRALFTTTWLNAGLLAQDLVHDGSLPDRIISTNNLTRIPLEHRTDAWKNPYCVFSGNEKIVVMSSNNQGPLQCGPLQTTAVALAASRTSSPQLKKLPNQILFTVFSTARLQN
jgi:hypothetical protein